MESVDVAQLCRGYFGIVTAEYVKRKEFYYAWRIKGDSIHIQISDYMKGCPEDVLSDMCVMICRRAKGLKWSESEAFLDYVTSDDFILNNRPTYIARSKNIIRSDTGDVHNLSKSVQRLLDSGILEESDITNSYISWTRRDSKRRVGFCSTMFRLVGISAALDSEDVSEHTLDYVVYHECLHLRQGYRPSHRVHDSVFRQWEHTYPGWQDAETALRKL